MKNDPEYMSLWEENEKLKTRLAEVQAERDEWWFKAVEEKRLRLELEAKLAEVAMEPERDEIDDLAWKFWSIHPMDIPAPDGMPEGYPGGLRAWFYARQMRRLVAVQPVVKVKPLVWDERYVGGFRVLSADEYEVWEKRDSAMIECGRLDGCHYPTLDAAKAAAQADYETRILAALDVQPAPDVAALVEALRWYSDDPSSQGDPARAALAAWEARKNMRRV